MNFSLSELISWLVTAISSIFTIVSVIQYYNEKKKSRSTYMAIQGLLKACSSKAFYYGNIETNFFASKRASVPSEEHRLLIRGTTSDFKAFEEITMGILKMTNPEEDFPYDTARFITPSYKGSVLSDKDIE